MSDHPCVQCSKRRPGRFTRRKGAAGGGWDQGHMVPHWHCYDCLPQGEGRDEEPMPKVTMADIVDRKQASGKPIPGLPAQDVSKVKTEGLSLIVPLEQAAGILAVTDAESYLVADQVLHRIQTARKTWKDRVEKIIRPIRQGLDSLYALNREVDRPLEALEGTVKGKMADFKREEQRLLREAEEQRQAEIDRLNREAAAKTAAAERAATPQMRGRILSQAARVMQQVVDVESEEVAGPVMAASSSTRNVFKPTVTDLQKFCKGVAEGYIPLDCVTAIQAQLNRYYKDDPEGMRAWPGVTIMEDMQIIGR